MGKLTLPRHLIRHRVSKRRLRRWALAWAAPVLLSAAILFGVHVRAAADAAPSASQLALYLQSNELGIGILPTGGYDQLYYLYDNRPVMLTTENYNHLEASSSGPNVVWQGIFNGAGQIFLHNVLTSATTQLTSYSNNQAPFIFGNIVTWQTWNGATWQIEFYDGSQIYRISSADYSSFNPVTDGKQIIYAQQISTDDWKAYSYDLATDQTTLLREGSQASTAYPHFSADGSIDTAFVPY